MSAELVTTEQAPLSTGLSVFDSGQFEQMGVIASKLAQSSLIPDTLKGKSNEQTAANCFRVVEQAQRWGLSPFAVMDAASVVHGKLMWEGKLIAAAIKATLGVRLRYEYSGKGDARKVIVSGEVDGLIETIEGTVADWKTTGKNSPWDKLANRDQMLAYRGARQWARRHAPEVILGVYAPDEVDESDFRNVTPEREKPEPLHQTSAPVHQPATTREPEPARVEDDNPALIQAYISGVDKKEGESNGKPWVRYRVGLSYGDRVETAVTFSTRLGDLAIDEQDRFVMVQTEQDPRGVKLMDLQTCAQPGEEVDGGIA